MTSPIITIEQLSKVNRIVYHSNCSDGISAALICSIAFLYISFDNEFTGNGYEFVAVNYGAENLDMLEPRPGTLFVDICPSRAVVDKWVEHKPIVLDHHISAKDMIEKLGGIFGDKSYSGALLAFEHVFMPLVNKANDKFGSFIFESIEMIKEFATLNMITDTWKSDHKDWYKARCVSAGVRKIGEKYLDITSHVTSPDLAVILSDIETIGKELFDADLSVASKFADDAYKFEYNGFNCSFLNITGPIISDTADILRKKYKTDLCIFATMQVDSLSLNKDNIIGKDEMLKTSANMIWNVSLRSCEGGIDCSKIAKGFPGGGGHKEAAGFRYPFIQHYEQIGTSCLRYTSLNDVLLDICKSINQ